jgi:hypothetical protein
MTFFGLFPDDFALWTLPVCSACAKFRISVWF